MNKIFLFGVLAVLLAAFDPKPTGTDAAHNRMNRTDTVPVLNKKITVYSTVAGTDKRLSQEVSLAFSAMGQPLETQPCVFIDPSKSFQTFLGIGGALTDASAETFAKLPKEQQEEFLTAYYNKDKGIGYTLARTNIHSCDFSSGSYTYVKDGDQSLASFSIDHDRTYRIPFIRRAIAAAGGKLQLFASPWSPPAWMKTNNDMLHGGKLKKEYYQPWANYFVRFVKAYEKEGIPVWGLTIQNEPMATQTWESCVFSAEDETKFLKNNLGPTLQKQGLGDKKIIVWDHNRDLIYQRASTLLNDKEASKYAWGVGFHWYEDWSGGDQVFENVRKVKESYPDKNLLFTEGCNGPFNMDSIQNWSLGERYGRSMINDFNNGTVGWTDWNVLLDEQGGPNHVKNFCFSPIHADTRSGKLIYTNAYYYIGHFSKFIKPGARRIESASSRSPLITTAFKNPDGKIVVIVMNSTNKELPFALWLEGKAAQTTSKAHSIMTFVI
ncbi:glycoside hydrolase family 30 protein [Flavisolibacter nicotianae]|uniref:glycoside hydrolase family 30 protein n=1 Tax=Flavisolibacter nicotianae TaxID=2364882 RepID=UPI000EAC3182|nr:glycoside hydrolase family 30 protein [Flavisolibacter nicotianae]